MKRLIFWVAILCVGVLFVGCGGKVDITSDDYKFDAINAQISIINTTLADLQKQLDELNGAQGITQETINILQVQIDILEVKNTELAAELAALRAQVATDNTNINIRLTALENAITGLQSSISDINIRLSVLEVAVAKVPQANSPLFTSVVITSSDVKVGNHWERDVTNPGVTIVWTASAGGATATSYNVWAVVVGDSGALGLPFMLANGIGSEYFWDGHTEGLPLGFNNGTNPTPLSAIIIRCVDTEKPPVYRFAVTAVDSNGNQSAPSVTADAIKVIPLPQDATSQ